MVLTVTDLDKRAIHQRLPDQTEAAVDDYGNQADDYDDLQEDVPIRTEQREIEAQDRGVADVISWTGWVLPTIANPPEIDDRFVIGTTIFHVDNVEGLTDLDGNLDHYEMDLTEVHVG